MSEYQKLYKIKPPEWKPGRLKDRWETVVILGNMEYGFDHLMIGRGFFFSWEFDDGRGGDTVFGLSSLEEAREKAEEYYVSVLSEALEEVK